MNLAPFSAANFGGANVANANFLTFISPNNGGRGTSLNRPGGGVTSNNNGALNSTARNLSASGQPLSNTNGMGTSANTIPPTANQSRADDPKNPAKRRKPPVVTGDGGLLLLPRSDQSPSPTQDGSNPVAPTNFTSLTSHLGNLPGSSSSSSSSSAGGGSSVLGQSIGGQTSSLSQQQLRRKHRVKTAASEMVLTSKAHELADFFKEHLPQHTVTNTATLAHWLKAIRDSQVHVLLLFIYFLFIFLPTLDTNFTHTHTHTYINIRTHQ
jgi:hypothetical protein